MENKLKNVINEWFSHSDSGFINPPYNEKDLTLLKIIVNESVDLTEDDKEKLTTHINNKFKTSPPPEKKEKQDRFIAKSAPFIQDATSFIQFINQEYLNPGIEITGLEELFNNIIALETEDFNNVVKLLAKHTNRQIDYGTFKMGQYELKLAELLHNSITLTGASYLNLLLAIIFNGKLSGTMVPNISKIGVNINGVMVIKNASSDLYVPLINFNDELSTIVNNLRTLNSVINDNDGTDTMSNSDLNELLKALQNGSLDDDIANIINQSKTTKVVAIKTLAGKLEQMLKGNNTSTIYELFKTTYNSLIQTSSKNITKIFDVFSDKILIETFSDLYNKLLFKDTIPSNIELGSTSINISSELLNLSGKEEKNTENNQQ